MNSQVIWEAIGYLGSALVLVSLLMSSIVRLRIINAVGSLIFAVYAFKINSLPTAIMNICLVLIDLYFLWKLLSSKKIFSHMEASSSDPSVKYIASHFAEDISKYFGTVDLSEADKILIVYENDKIAGMLAGVSEGGGALRLLMDYSTPQYRDCKVGAYLYSVLAAEYSRLIYAGSNPGHIPYCLKMGFELKDGKYVKMLQR